MSIRNHQYLLPFSEIYRTKIKHMEMVQQIDSLIDNRIGTQVIDHKLVVITRLHLSSLPTTTQAMLTHATYHTTSGP
jgi:hypothetical protein